MNNAIIIGASSGVGKALAYELASKNYNLILVARNYRDLQAIKSDLEIKYQSNIHVLSVDLYQNFSVQQFLNDCTSRLPIIEELYITAGISMEQDFGLVNEEIIDQIVRVNYYTIVQIINEFTRSILPSKRGSITVVSSIAAAAPRSQNLVYASAKKGLETYCQGLRHFLADQNISVNIIILGYADTALAYGKKLLFPVAAPNKVAKHIYKLRTKNVGRTFYPHYWKYVTFIISLVPWPIYKRLKF